MYCRILLLQQTPKLGRIKPSTGHNWSRKTFAVGIHGKVAKKICQTSVE